MRSHFIRAWKADTAGNLVYRMTEQNFNPLMATAADLVIAEVEEIVPVGTLDPNLIHTQGCFVDFLVKAKLEEKDLGSSASVKGSLKKVDEARMAIAKRVLKELKPGHIVNLGIGIPTLVADLIGPEDGIILHTENGMLGVGPEPEDGSGALVNPVNAGKIPVTALPGASYFDSSTSFGMIRGQHVDVAVMGGLQVDRVGNLANWAVPGKPLLGVGGAMDLASGAKRLIITMQHLNNNGSSKIVEVCNLPITARKAVDMIITDLAVFEVNDDQLILTELMPGVTLEQVRNGTEASFIESI
ncbi:MAG: 3-oxoacid CoA-transferase subunit B [Bacteroidetes bacterium]|nr:3-oxoacid CoA-transferase subunit B [Bacteroidota bacterium]